MGLWSKYCRISIMRYSFVGVQPTTTNKYNQCLQGNCYPSNTTLSIIKYKRGARIASSHNKNARLSGIYVQENMM